MTRHYARSKKNERAVDSTPVNTPCSTTILSSVRLNGKTSYTVYCGGTTGERFAEYLKTKLIPTLSKTDVIVMDNMRSHHAKIVKQVLDESEIKYVYLPPYSRKGQILRSTSNTAPLTCGACNTQPEGLLTTA